MGNEFQPTNELDYVNYLKIIMGRHDEGKRLSPALTEFVKNYRPSLAHSPDNIMLCFMQTPPESDVPQNSLRPSTKVKLVTQLK